MKSYTVVVEQDQTGELILPIPQEIIDHQGWFEGDTLNFVDNKDGSWTLYSLQAAKPTTNTMLFAMLGSKKFVDAWWDSPNLAFNLKHPRDCDAQAVYEYVLQHYAG